MEEPRHVKLQKGSEPLGISIVSGEKGGVYVSKVTGGSIAHQAGLEYGDQLLEVSGSLPAVEKWCPRVPIPPHHCSLWVFPSSMASICGAPRSSRPGSSSGSSVTPSPSWPSTTHTCTSSAATPGPGEGLASEGPSGCSGAQLPLETRAFCCPTGRVA